MFTAEFTPGPTPPTTGNPITFPALADAWVAWLTNVFVQELITFVEQLTTEAELLEMLGVLGFALTFDGVSTADADPGAGKLRLNQLAQNTATVLRIDDVDALGVSIAAHVLSFDDAAEAIKGTLYVYSVADPAKRLAFNVTACAAGAGYTNVTGTCVEYSGASPFNDGEEVKLAYVRNGALGTTLLADVTRAGTYTAFTAGGGGVAQEYTLATVPPLTGVYAAHVGKKFRVKFTTQALRLATDTPMPHSINIDGLGSLRLKKFTYAGLEDVVRGDFKNNQTADVLIYDANTAVLLERYAQGERILRKEGMALATAAAATVECPHPTMVQKVVMEGHSLNTNGSSPPTVRAIISSGGSIQTTGYEYTGCSFTTSAVSSSTTTGGSGMHLATGWGAANNAHFRLEMERVDGVANRWNWTLHCSLVSAAQQWLYTGSVELSGGLFGLQITMQNGTDLFETGVLACEFSF